ncbi:MAG: hypothetical protein RLZZ15_4286 [Verrucomicrobiota bacterium]|jgi:hypothetical protein
MTAITIKVSPAEARTLRAQARASNRTVSAYLRTVVFPARAPRPRKRVIKNHPVSGLPFDATPGPAVSFDEVKAALADFP